MFDDIELAYLRSQPLARLATVGPDGQPDNSPVGFELDDDVFWIGGFDVPATRKYRNVVAGATLAALVVDDLESVEPWRPRGIRVYGTIDVVDRQGRFGSAPYLRLTPTVTWSWALEVPFGGPDSPQSRKRTVWR
ncbi:MAG TPA: PPOX class F420-dependent oxidoreductase [Acidimicrobiales bacterium]|jgi:pyridoxamine 5'-phosphate oxidase family protein